MAETDKMPEVVTGVGSEDKRAVAMALICVAVYGLCLGLILGFVIGRLTH